MYQVRKHFSSRPGKTGKQERIMVNFCVYHSKWILGDSNPGPTGYEPVALTN